MRHVGFGKKSVPIPATTCSHFKDEMDNIIFHSLTSKLFTITFLEIS